MPASDRQNALVLARTWRAACRTSLISRQPLLVIVQSRIVNKLILAAPAAIALAACGVATTAAPSGTAALTAARQPLSCRADMSNPRPADNTTTVVHVHTQASVKVFTVAFYKTVRRAYFVRAGSDGQARVPYYVSGATPGRKVEVVVRWYGGTPPVPARLHSRHGGSPPRHLRLRRRRREAHRPRLRHTVPPHRAPLRRRGAIRAPRRAIAMSPASTAQTLIMVCTA